MHTQVSESLTGVMLHWPTSLAATTLDRPSPAMVDHLADVADDLIVTPNTRVSWIQLAVTGSFVSSRYGKFSITPNDLTQMLSNFRTITPIAPTRLPIDYDHLSMDPQKPGDGKAAGWIVDLELRAGGNQLWGLVDWTDDGADAVRKKEYQFVSPSFVKDYVYKDGKQIGTTLLAAAITNHPFLEGMAALTLSGGLAEMGHLLAAPPWLKKKKAGEGDPDAADEPDTADPAEGDPNADPDADPNAPPKEKDLGQGGVAMDVGQKVGVKDTEIQKPEQLGVTFTIQDVVGEGADAFASLLAPDGTVAEWFRADELQPAPAPALPMPNMPGAPVAATTPPIAAPVNARETHMKTFQLKDTNGVEVTIGEDVLTAIAEKVTAVVPEGKQLVDSTEYNTMRSTVDTQAAQVKLLNEQVAVLATANEQSVSKERQTQLTAKLDTMSRAAFITKDERDWAFDTYKDAVDLSGFDKWASTKKAPIVALRTEHGSGQAITAGQSAAESATDKIRNKAMQLSKDLRIPYRDAVIRASRELAGEAETYREQFAQFGQPGGGDSVN